MGRVMASIDASGRLVVPKDMRVSLGVEGGGELLLSLENGALVAMTRAEALRRLQDALGASGTGAPSLAEELLAERRAEAKRLAGGG
jgi:bifunctional DNA-binding transcriptional regulator/antitoxin component of YhaV-PrlF toxin-antitoxin module